jgi:hypothetical protein
MLPQSLKHIKVSLGDNGSLKFELIPMSCDEIPKYCQEKDPSDEYMNTVTAMLINEAASQTDAQILLLHFEGPVNDPFLKLISPKVKIIQATQYDYNYFTRDDIIGFDGHPGPYWHYSKYEKISKYLESSR